MGIGFQTVALRDLGVTDLQAVTASVEEGSEERTLAFHASLMGS